MAKLLQLCFFVAFAATLTQSVPPGEGLDTETILMMSNELRNELAAGLEETQPGEKCYMKALKWNDCIAENAKLRVEDIKNYVAYSKFKKCAGLKVQYNQKRDHFSKDKLKQLDMGDRISKWYNQVKNITTGADPNDEKYGVIGKYRKMAGADVEYVGCAQLSWVDKYHGFNAYVCGYGTPEGSGKGDLYINKDDCDCDGDECAEKDSYYPYLCTKMKPEDEDEDCDEE